VIVCDPVAAFVIGILPVPHWIIVVLVQSNLGPEAIPTAPLIKSPTRAIPSTRIIRIAVRRFSALSKTSQHDDKSPC